MKAIHALPLSFCLFLLCSAALAETPSPAESQKGPVKRITPRGQVWAAHELKALTLQQIELELSDPKEWQAVQVALELHQRDSPQVRDIIVRVYPKQHYTIKSVLAEILMKYDPKLATEYLEELARSSSEKVSTRAAALLAVKNPVYYDMVNAKLVSPDPAVRKKTASTVLSVRGVHPDLHRTALRVSNEQGNDPKDVLAHFATNPDAESLDQVAPYTRAPHEASIRLSAIRSVSMLEKPELVVPVLLPLLDDPDESIAVQAARAFGKVSGRQEWVLTETPVSKLKLPEARKQIKQWWAEESAKAQKPDSVQ